MQGELCLGPGCPNTSLPVQSRAPGLLQKDSGATSRAWHCSEGCWRLQSARGERLFGSIYSRFPLGIRVLPPAAALRAQAWVSWWPCSCFGILATLALGRSLPGASPAEVLGKGPDLVPQLSKYRDISP